jgi:hypothetical protein
MLNRCYHIVRSPGISAMDGVTATYLLDHRLKDELLLRHIYSEEGNHPFSIALSNTTATDELLKKILLFLFHPFYSTSSKGSALFVYGGTAGTQSLLCRLSSLLEGQGLRPHLLYVPGQPGNGGTRHLSRSGECTLLPAEADLAEYYYSYCMRQYDPEDIFLFEGPGRQEEAINAVLCQLRRQAPLLYRLAGENRSLREQADQFDRKRSQWEAEEKILKELLELSGRRDELSEVLQFYHREYEVLPLWYKRIGHLLKVIMGKRTLASLFGKPAKKQHTKEGE